MSRYIDADKFKKTTVLQAAAGNIDTLQAEALCKIVDNQPTADVVPVRHAHWNGIEYDSYADGYPVYDKWECSKCGNEISTEDPPTYCCDCGAKMDESVKQ